jgi:hypothetical protein
MLGGIRWAAIAGAVLLLAAGCGIDEPPTLGPLVADQELWRSTDADAISLAGASLHGETALLLGGGKDGPA